MSETLSIGSFHLERDECTVDVWSDAPLAVLSSAVVGSELPVARHAPHGGFASGTSTDSIVIATTARGARGRLP